MKVVTLWFSAPDVDGGSWDSWVEAKPFFSELKQVEFVGQATLLQITERALDDYHCEWEYSRHIYVKGAHYEESPAYRIKPINAEAMEAQQWRTRPHSYQRMGM